MSISKVEDGLYISDYKAASNKGLLKKLGIKAVVSMIPSKDTPKFLGVRYYVFPTEDRKDYDIAERATAAAKCVAAERAAGNRVLVHCHAGISRSATVVMIYLMWRDDIGADGALKRLKKVRPQVQPNPGFMRFLNGYGINQNC
jgi:dual specificity phosphatase 12